MSQSNRKRKVNGTLVGSSAIWLRNVQQGPLYHWLLLVRLRLWRQRKCSGEPPDSETHKCRLAAPCWCKESFLGGISWKTTLPPNIVIFEPHLKLRTTSGGSAAGLHICIIRLHLSAWDSHWPRLNMAENVHQISIEMFQCDMLEGLPSKFCEYQNSSPTLPHPAPQDGPRVRYKWSSNPHKNGQKID